MMALEEGAGNARACLRYASLTEFALVVRNTKVRAKADTARGIRSRREDVWTYESHRRLRHVFIHLIDLQHIMLFQLSRYACVMSCQPSNELIK